MAIKQIFFMLTLITIGSNSLAHKPRVFNMNTNPDRFEQSLTTDRSRFGKTFVLEKNGKNFDYMGKLEDVNPQATKDFIQGVLQRTGHNQSIEAFIYLAITADQEIKDIAIKTLELTQKNKLNQELLQAQVKNHSEIACVLCPSFGTYKDQDYDAIIFDTDDVNECEELKKSTQDLSDEQKEKILEQN